MLCYSNIERVEEEIEDFFFPIILLLGPGVILQMKGKKSGFFLFFLFVFF